MRTVIIAVFAGICALAITGCQPEEKPTPAVEAAVEAAGAATEAATNAVEAAPKKPLDHPAH